MDWPRGFQNHLIANDYSAQMYSVLSQYSCVFQCENMKIYENDCARARTKKSFAALMIEINSVTSLVVL